jgi:aspartate 1-decarboxylase
MKLILMKSKLHKARLTDAVVDYEGSLEIDTALLRAARMQPYERILVVNATNGERLETYAIPGAAGSGVMRLNGAAAHLGRAGDEVTVMSFAVCDEHEAAAWQPTVVVLDERNRVVRTKGPAAPGGQAMVEYAALLALFVMVAVTLTFLLAAFNNYGWRIINLIGLDYP